MAKANSVQTEDRVALSVLLMAGADPDRLANWYADNSDSSRDDITAALASMRTALMH